MIEVVGLNKSFGSRRVLTGASLTVNPGESVALVGANGSGKTTTLRCAVGLTQADGGSIRIDGHDLARQPQAALGRLSYLAQRTELPATLTVREILTVVADLRRTPRESVEREIALCGLAGLAGRTAARLSGGERQRVAMAVLFIPDVAAYLLDEPTLNLDPIGTRLLIHRLRTLRDEGCAVLFTTHVGGDLDDLATRVGLLHNGRILSAELEMNDGERHMSIAVQDPRQRCVAAALAAGVKRAWLSRGRLHVFVGQALISALLARLDHEGVRIGEFRTEGALAGALERLIDEEQENEIESADSPYSITNRAHGELQPHSWAGADSPGSR
jgi:ABC-2 type transport system ATP-binding protein